MGNGSGTHGAAFDSSAADSLPPTHGPSPFGPPSSLFSATRDAFMPVDVMGPEDRTKATSSEPSASSDHRAQQQQQQQQPHGPRHRTSTFIDTVLDTKPPRPPPQKQDSKSQQHHHGQLHQRPPPKHGARTDLPSTYIPRRSRLPEPQPDPDPDPVRQHNHFHKYGRHHAGTPSRINTSAISHPSSQGGGAGMPPQNDEPMDIPPPLPHHDDSLVASRKPSWPSSAGSAYSHNPDPADLPQDHDSPSSSSAAAAAAPPGHLRTLLPAPTDEHLLAMQPARKKPMVGRVQVAAACLACRKRKVKCNGGRPTCHRCAEQKLACEYDADLDSTRMLTLKRRQVELKTELDDLRDLFSFLQTRPDTHALDIFRRIRASPTGEYRTVVNSVRNGELLLPDAAASSSACGPDDIRAARTLDESAAAEPYAIHVPARPWTTIAGDGLVSELVGSFFAWDATFWLPFIDRTCFVQDMRMAKPGEAKYCSPLLVHAICALRCSTSPRAKAMSSIYGFDIRERFLSEAKRILDHENGRVSLPTAWALAILFICYSSQGRDRAGMMYRFTSYDMLRRMRLQQRLELKRETEGAEAATVALRVYSRSLWGMYAFESCAAFIYLNPTAFPRPKMPRMFHDPEVARRPANSAFVDDYPLSMAILDASCDLADIYNEVMLYNRQAKADEVLGSPADLERRMLHCREVQACRETLPVDIRSDLSFTSATFFLDCYADQVLLAIFRPLHRDTVLPDSGLGTAGDVCVACCEAGVAGAERCERETQMRSQGYSVMVTYPLYNAAVTLVSMLDQPRAHGPFARACRLLAEMQEDYLLTAYCLHGVRAMAERMGFAIPPAARPFFADLRVGPSQLHDVPISFVVPGWDDAVEFWSHEGGAVQDEGLGVEMGTLIARWNSMSAT